MQVLYVNESECQCRGLPQVFQKYFFRTKQMIEKKQKPGESSLLLPGFFR
jgi:hypothetical protein